MRWTINLASLLLLAAGLSAQSMTGGGPGARGEDVADCIRFGVRELEAALAGAASRATSATSPTKITVESMQQPALHPRRSRYEAAVPASAEAYAIRRTGNAILVLGGDAVGVMNGALELAEIVRQTGSPAGVADTAQLPFRFLRAANQFLFEEALEDPYS